MLSLGKEQGYPEAVKNLIDQNSPCPESAPRDGVSNLLLSLQRAPVGGEASRSQALLMLSRGRPASRTRSSSTSAGRADIQLRNHRSQLALCVFLGTEPRKSRGGEALNRSECPSAGMADFRNPRCCDMPSRFGCTPAFFEQVVQWSLESGARLLPVVEALKVLKASQPKQEGMLR